jgi:PAS domain S-box-containing protein
LEKKNSDTPHESSEIAEKAFRYRLLAERSFDIVAVQNISRKLVYVNQIWTQTLGYSVEESIGQHISTFISPKDNEAGLERNKKRRDGAIELFKYRAEMVAKDGTSVPVEVQSSPIYVQDGVPSDILIVARDLREQERQRAALEESKNRYRELFESAPIAMWVQDFSAVKAYLRKITDEKGIADLAKHLNDHREEVLRCVKLIKITDANQGAVALYKAKNKEDLLSTNLSNLLLKDSLDAVQRAIVALWNGEKEFSAETQAKQLDGRPFIQSVHWRMANPSDDSWERIIVSTQNISELKKAEITLKQQLNELNVLQASAFTCAQARDVDTLLRQITNIIGNTLYPDIYGIFLVDEKQKTLTAHSSYSFISDKEEIAHPFERGLTGKAARTQKAIRADDVRKYPEYIVSNPAIRSELCVPIKVSDQVLGVLNVESVRPDHFTATDERLLSTIATQVATAMQKLHSLEEEKKKRNIAETLQKVTATLTNSRDLDNAIETILNELNNVVEFTSASIQLLRGDHLEIVGGRGELVIEKEKDRIFPYPGDNPNTRVVDERRPLIINDAQDSYSDFKDMPEILSWLGVPLIAQKRAIGILTLDSNKKNHFNHDDATLVTSFAHHAALTIENAQLFEAEQKRREESETLRETALALTSTLDLDGTIQQILEQLNRVLPYDSAAIQVLKDNELIMIGGRGWENTEEVLNLRFPIPGNNPNTQVIQERSIVILDDAHQEHAPFREEIHNQTHSWMGIPMIFRDKIIGMLAVDSKEKNRFNMESAEIARAFATQAAIAIENARLHNAEKKRRQEAETLRQAAHTISSSLDLDEVLKTILASIKRVIPFYSAAVMLFKGNEVEISSGYNLPQKGSYIGKRFSIDNDELFQNLVKTKHPIILKDAQKEASFGKWGETNYVRGWMAIPLIVRGDIIGYITLDSKKVDAYQQKHAELAQVFVHQAASAINNARLYEDAIKTAERRAVLHKISQEISRGIQSPEKIYQTVYQAAENLIPCDAFVITLRYKDDPENDHAVYLAEQGEKYGAISVPRAESIIATAEQNNLSVICNDINAETINLNRKNRFGSPKKAKALIISPMLSGNELIGAISAQSYETNTYNAEHTVLLDMLAAHAAAAIENARLLAESEQRGREFAELYQVSQDLVTNPNTDLLLEAMLERATKLIGVSYAGIYIYDESSAELVASKFYGLSEPDQRKMLNIRLKLGEGLAGRVAKERKPMQIANYQDWEKRSDKHKNTVKFAATMELPLVYSGDLLGVLALFEIVPNTHQFSENDQRIMSLFASQLASALHSAKQLKQITTRLAELETIDQLSAALRTTESPEDMLPILLDEVSKSLHVDTCAIWITKPHTDEIYRAKVKGWIGKIPPERQKTNVGIIGRVFTHNEPYHTKDIATDTHIKTKKTDLIPPNWSGLWLPIHTSHMVTGVIGIMAEAPREFNRSDIQILSIMAEIAGNAFHRAQLHLRTEQQLKRLTALRNIDTSISAHAELKLTLQLLIEQTVNQLEVDAAAILLVEKTTKNLHFFVGSGFKDPSIRSTTLRANTGILGKAIQQHEIAHTHNPEKDACPERRNWFAEESFTCYYAVPLNAKGNILGVLEIFNKTHLNSPPEWLDFLKTLAGQAAIAIDNHELVEDLKKSNEELARAYDTTLEGWGKALELRDKETQGHTINVTELTLKLARYMGISENEMVHIYRGSLLHDIGKMGIPDNILRKPGPLTKDEWKIMRQHPQFAYNMLSSIPYLRPAVDIPYSHHERWDGSGYPRGLKGEEIPLAARIFSIIDVWDALLTDRPYREAWPKEVVIDYIRNESGTRFDPEVVKKFIEMVNQEEEF